MLPDLEGEIELIEPTRIFKDNTSSAEIGEFFLALAVVYNDLKGIFFFSNFLKENFRKPESGEQTYHAGEIGGLSVQIDKIIIGVTKEFLKLIKESKDVVGTSEFEMILEPLSSILKQRWKHIVQLALGKNSKKDKTTDSEKFLKVLEKIRGNVGFHYHQSGKILRRAFVKRFIETEKKATFRNQNAFYSISEGMQQTRFFYADAAVEEYMRSVAGYSLGELPPGQISYGEDLKQILIDMHLLINSLLKEYLRTRPHI